MPKMLNWASRNREPAKMRPKQERERERTAKLTMGSERELEITRNWSNKEAMNRLSYQRKQEWTALDPVRRVVASERGGGGERTSPTADQVTKFDSNKFKINKNNEK